jgi:hypothetical protein
MRLGTYFICSETSEPIPDYVTSLYRLYTTDSFHLTTYYSQSIRVGHSPVFSASTLVKLCMRVEVYEYALSSLFNCATQYRFESLRSDGTNATETMNIARI